MEAAKILLISAQALLSMLFSNPNLPEDFRINAMNTATTAIIYAQTELAQTAPVQISKVAQPQVEPQIITDTRKSDDMYIIKVAVVENEAYIPNAEITMIAEDNFWVEEWAYHRKTTARTYGFDDWHTEFTYKPTKGLNKVTFKYLETFKDTELQ